jgi:UDP-N-acetylmuramoylalanine-D-glutamate ligase
MLIVYIERKEQVFDFNWINCRTPRASRKSQIITLNNGRSVRVQKYEGIQLITPNKSHTMETRMDLVINSPGLSLRSRSVTKKVSTMSRIDTINESKTEKVWIQFKYS